MATIRKKTTGATKKATNAAAPAAPAPARPAGPAAPATAVPPKSITREERRRMIEEAAYYIAEKNGFTGSASENWDQAEAQIDAELARKGVKVV